MRYLPVTAAAALCLSTLTGCCTAHQPPAVVEVDVWEAPAANLLLSPDPEDLRLAQAMVGRADWPTADLGYRLDDVTFFSSFNFEYQSGFDRYGGLYFGNDTIESGVRVR